MDKAVTRQPRLRDRALNAGMWTVAAYGSDLIVRLLSNLILTRLLFPEAFGAIAASSALISGLMLVSDFGVRAVVIQSPRGDQADFLSSAWLFQLWRGIVLWLILVAVCALLSVSSIQHFLPAASVFADRSFLPITIALGFGLVLSGAESIFIPLNMRRLNYRPIVFVDLASKIPSVVVMLVWAWLAPNVWSLVAGGLASGLFRVVLSHAYLPGPPMSLIWKRDHIREILGFGRWIAVSSIATFFSQQSDVILLGFVAPGYVLGLYSIAKLLIGAGEGLLDRLSSAIALPIFGEVLRKDPAVFRNRYYRFRLPTDLAAGLLSGGLLVAGNFIVGFLYDPRYAEAGVMCQLLALGTLSFPLSLVGNAFTATGDTHVNAFASILKAVSLLACMAVGFFLFGVNGAVAGVALHRVFPSALMVLFARQRNWIGVWEELRIVPAFVAGALIGKMGVLAAGALGIENIHQLLHA